MRFHGEAQGLKSLQNQALDLKTFRDRILSVVELFWSPFWLLKSIKTKQRSNHIFETERLGIRFIHIEQNLKCVLNGFGMPNTCVFSNISAKYMRQSRCFLKKWGPGSLKDAPNEVQMGPGGGTGAKEGLIRECDCSGSAPGVLSGPIWRPFRGHFEPQNRYIWVSILW